MIKVTGKGNISATIIAHSKSAVDGKEIITYELEYHRYIHSECLTHRNWSRNAASSRAIPVAKMIDLVRTSPATPIYWGKNQAGMQANEECNNEVSLDWDYFNDIAVEGTPEDAWREASSNAIYKARCFDEAGYHKQIVNRLLEPFQMIKVVVTATEWDNFFWLRFHKAAQPEIQELARCMLVAKKRSVAEVLNVGEWHTPYVDHWRDEDGLKYILEDEDGQGFFCNIQEALKVSASCCAQVSYRKTDDSLEKADKVWQMLTTEDRIHSSPTEHQATPIEAMNSFWGMDLDAWDIPKGVTHVDIKDGNLWSNNFCGWIQHRALIANNNCTSFDYDQEIDETGLAITDNKGNIMKYKKQGKNNISRNISESDLATFKEYDGSIAVRNQLLYKLGVDTSLLIEVLKCSHRNLQGKVVEDNLFMGFERLDKEWVKSGWASDEAFLASSNDPTLAKEVHEMNKGVYSV